MYIVDLLTRLTGIDLVKWVGNKEKGFETKIGRFILRIFEKRDLVPEKRFFGKEKLVMKDLWVLMIKDSNGSFEELSGEFGSRINTLWYLAISSSEREPSSTIQGKLFLEILREFDIQRP